MAEKKTVALRVTPELHAAWTKAAKKAGVPLAAYVEAAVEQIRASGTPARAAARAASTVRTASVRPQDCTARVRAGSYCRRRDSIHVKGI